MIKFSNLIVTKKSGCAKCFSIIYAIPCQLDKDIALYLEANFGKPIYPLKSITLLKIDTGDGFHIEGRLNSKIIKFTLPKKYEHADLTNLKRKNDFDEALAKWMSKKLNITIVMG